MVSILSRLSLSWARNALDLILLVCWTIRRVGPRHNEPLHNEVPALTNDIFSPINNEPLYGYFRGNWSRDDCITVLFQEGLTTLVLQWCQRNLTKSVLHVQSFLVSVVVGVALSSLVALPRKKILDISLICYDFARKKPTICSVMENARRNRRLQVLIERLSDKVYGIESRYTKKCSPEHILPVPCPFVITRFHRKRCGKRDPYSYLWLAKSDFNKTSWSREIKFNSSGAVKANLTNWSKFTLCKINTHWILSHGQRL